MTDHSFDFCGTRMIARGSGALWLPASQTLCVSDLHLGKSGRIARRAGTMLPPYETTDTLHRLSAEVDALAPARVICLGDSFDDLDAATELTPQAAKTIAGLQAGRDWIWIEGNHDPGPVSVGGSHRGTVRIDQVTFRHIASSTPAEVSGHYHPKHGLSGAGPARACFLYDDVRIIMPAFGTYTGGLRATDPVLTDLMQDTAIAVLTGAKAIALPVRQNRRQRHSGGRSY